VTAVERCGCTPRLEPLPFDEDGDGIGEVCRRCGDYIALVADPDVHDEVARLRAWTTRVNCPPGCDGSYTNSGHEGAWSSDHYGRCRHGSYVAGSGADLMCGLCEQYSVDEEIAELEKGVLIP
jgi:hypothetical protein